MRPKELFVHAARNIAPSCEGRAASERWQRQEDELKSLATSLLDKIFKTFPEETGSILPHVMRSSSVDLEGKAKVSTMPETKEVQKQLITRWVELKQVASEEFQIFAPEGHTVFLTVLVGARDVMYPVDSGWTSNRTASLDIITYLESIPDDDNDDEHNDVFEFTPPVLERTNYTYPVFVASEDSGGRTTFDPGGIMDSEPEIRKHSSAEDLIASMAASLDIVAEALARFEKEKAAESNPYCYRCGCATSRAGSAYVCADCGTTFACV